MRSRRLGVLRPSKVADSVSGGGLAQQVDENVDLLGIAAGPFGLVAEWDDGEVGFGLLAAGAGDLVAELWNLIVGAQPADEAAGFFGSALLVEGDEAGQRLFSAASWSSVLYWQGVVAPGRPTRCGARSDQS